MKTINKVDTIQRGRFTYHNEAKNVICHLKNGSHKQLSAMLEFNLTSVVV